MPWFHSVFHGILISPQEKQVTKAPGKRLCQCPAPGLLNPPSASLWWSLPPYVVLQLTGPQILNDDLPGKQARSEQGWPDPGPSSVPPRTPTSTAYTGPVLQWDTTSAILLDPAKLWSKNQLKKLTLLAVPVAVCLAFKSLVPLN